MKNDFSYSGPIVRGAGHYFLKKNLIGDSFFLNNVERRIHDLGFHEPEKPASRF